MSKTIGGQAKELVLLFYNKTGLKFTNKDIMVSVKKAKDLLKAGYTFDEIKDTIEYCVANQPEKGIYSFGFICHEINKVTTMLKMRNKKILKETAIDSSKFNDYGITKVSNKDKVKLENETKTINIFD